MCPILKLLQRSTAEPASSSEEKYVGLTYGYQILIILVVVLFLAMLIAFVIKHHKQPVPVAAASTPCAHNEQFNAQPYSADDPEHTGYDQPNPGNQQRTMFYDITLHKSDVLYGNRSLLTT